MASNPERCAHCQSPIVDSSTRVTQGGRVYCCPNCSAAMEGAGGGSDPHAGTRPGALRCAHCGVPIVDAATMESRGDQTFCCHNCAAAMTSPSR